MAGCIAGDGELPSHEHEATGDTGSVDTEGEDDADPTTGTADPGDETTGAEPPPDDPDTDTDDEPPSDDPPGGGNVGLCDEDGAPQDGLLPLTDLTGSYEGFTGCLYPGSNQHPLPHPVVAPVDGRIGFGSIGMSNAAQEFTYFVTNVATPPPDVVMFNGAQGGQTSAAWSDPDDPVWTNFAGAVAGAGLSPEQVQVVWVKSALAHNGHAELEQAALAEKAALEDVLRNLAAKYPSVRIAYLTSRAYGGYGCGLSPEPAAFAHGLAIKWIIEEQIEGLHGDMPFLAWGPYIWADGATPRSDGHAWLPEDFQDGCHPGEAGRQKVADLMQRFFVEEAPWYAPK